MTEFTERILAVLSSVPKGKVLTYGIAAEYAGFKGMARQVSWILHSMSGKYGLPWHRIVNSQGKISLYKGKEGNLQEQMLAAEGIIFGPGGKINLKKYLWEPE